MSKRLIIEKKGEEIAIAFLEKEKLVEYHTQKEAGYQVGDFYLGKVRKLIPGMNAAFVHIGCEKDGFLHYTDLSPYIHTILKYTESALGQPLSKEAFTGLKIEPEILKKGKIQEVFKHKPRVLVQILKEPIGNKGPRLTCEFVLPGRYIVLRPFSNEVSVSKKIRTEAEKKRLKKILNTISQNNFGLIIRTAAEHRSEEELLEDLRYLQKEWWYIQRKLFKAHAPKRVRKEAPKSITLIRDLINQDFSSILVNDEMLYHGIEEFIQKRMPDKRSILQYVAANYSIMDRAGVSKQLRTLFGKNVLLPSGAHLFIEKTEALHVIDVNSGNRKLAVEGQEANALETNLEAAEEIVRQIRLRDLGGILIIDFIDIRLPEHKKQVYDKMLSLMKTDRAKHIILPLSKFNIMQITRQRIRPEVHLDVQEPCFACKGTGKITPLVHLEEEIQRGIAHKCRGRRWQWIHIKVHPLVYSYLKSGWMPLWLRWSCRYRCLVRLNVDKELMVNQFVVA